MKSGLKLKKKKKKKKRNLHPLKFRCSTTGDLLDTKRSEFSLQFIQLLGEIVLALSPELTGLDLVCRLYRKRTTLAFFSFFLSFSCLILSFFLEPTILTGFVVLLNVVAWLVVDDGRGIIQIFFFNFFLFLVWKEKRVSDSGCVIGLNAERGLYWSCDYCFGKTVAAIAE